MRRNADNCCLIMNPFDAADVERDVTWNPYDLIPKSDGTSTVSNSIVVSLPNSA